MNINEFMTKYNYKLILTDTGEVFYFIDYRIAEHNYLVEKKKGHQVELIAII